MTSRWFFDYTCFVKNQILVLFFIIGFCSLGYSKSLKIPQNVKLDCSEKAIDVSWDSIPEAYGYNVYSRNSITSNTHKVNKNIIKSGCRFRYIWDLEKGERVKKIKGFSHYISVRAVYKKKKSRTESKHSTLADNQYFNGYKNVWNKNNLQNVLIDSQTVKPLPLNSKPTNIKDVLSFLKGNGIKLTKLIRKEINALETGGCVPISTLVVNLLLQNNIEAFRAEGTFIEEFHSFVILNIEGNEYILDFAANQFLPNVSPVLIPREKAFLNENSRLDFNGKPIYIVERLFNADQCIFADNKEAKPYIKILNKFNNSSSANK